MKIFRALIAGLVFGAVTAVNLPALSQAIQNPFQPDSNWCSTQGAVATRKGTSWGCLLPGTSGQVLKSGGPGADISWLTVTGTGTVTSVALTVPTFLSVSGSPITGAGTFAVSLANQSARNVFAGPTTGNPAAAPTFRTLEYADLPTIANASILANVSGGVGAASATTLSAILDSAISSTQGAIVYRNAAGWVALSPGTSGQYLTTNGAGANPSWSAVTGANGGTVTQVSTGSGLTGGPINVTGTISGVAFTGATSGAGGALGMVPAPSAGDQAKVLLGSGAWGSPVGNGVSKTIYTSGSGTYTTPANAVTLRVRMLGGGGGGGGKTGAGGAGGTSTFGASYSASGGGGGALEPGSAAVAPDGGTGANCDINLVGEAGTPAALNNGSNAGGSSQLGAGGKINISSTATAGQAASGYGAGGAGSTGSTGKNSGGGAAGGYCEVWISSPSASYSYAVGAAGTAGAGTPSGGTGSGGIIIVEAF